MNITHFKHMRTVILKTHYPEQAEWESKKLSHFLNTLPYSEYERFSTEIEKLILGSLWRSDFDWEAYENKQFLEELNALKTMIFGTYDSDSDSFFYLNEMMADNISISSFNSVYDYDKDDNDFQVKCRKEEGFTDIDERHYCNLSEWARVVYRDEFHYAHLLGIATYIHFALDDLMFDLIQEIFPHEYVSGPNDGDITPEGHIVWDQVQDAQGKEKQLDQLQKACWDYLSDNQKQLQSQYCDANKGIVVMTEHPDEISKNNDFYFIFFDHDSMKKIRFEHFMSDIEKHQLKNEKFLERIKAQELAKFKKFIHETANSLK